MPRYGGILMLALAMFLSHLSFRNVQLWVDVSQREQMAVREIVSQTDAPLEPIIIVSYPHRVLQTSMFWSLDHRLHHAFFHSFGRMENVWVGFGIVGSDLDSIGSSVSISPADLQDASFEIRSTSPEEYLMIDHSQVPPEFINIIERPGYVGENKLARSECMELSVISRPSRYVAAVKDTAVWNRGTVFIWSHGRFERVR